VEQDEAEEQQFEVDLISMVHLGESSYTCCRHRALLGEVSGRGVDLRRQSSLSCSCQPLLSTVPVARRALRARTYDLATSAFTAA
jgi:hypothetical protein